MGTQSLTMTFIFWGFPYHVSLRVLLFLATLQWHWWGKCSVLELPQCTPVSWQFVPRAFAHCLPLFQLHRWMFLKHSSTDCMAQLWFTGLTLAWSGPAGSHGLWWFCSCLLVFTPLALSWTAQWVCSGGGFAWLCGLVSSLAGAL